MASWNRSQNPPRTCRIKQGQRKDPSLKAMREHVRKQRERRKRDAAARQIPTCRTCCPDCHVMHDVPLGAVGMSNWDLCPKCSRQDDQETRRVLAERGIVLPY